MKSIYRESKNDFIRVEHVIFFSFLSLNRMSQNDFWLMLNSISKAQTSFKFELKNLLKLYQIIIGIMSHLGIFSFDYTK